MLPLSENRDETGTLRCDKADLLGSLGKMEEAEKEYASIFLGYARLVFWLIQICAFLGDMGQRNKAVEVLEYLISIKDKLDRETYEEAVFVS